MQHGRDAHEFVLAIGAAMVDIDCRLSQQPIAGDSTPGRIRSAPGGVARNVAENLARLGHRVVLISAVGDDPAAQGLLHQSALAGIDMSGCLVLPGQATPSYVSVHGPDGELRMAVNDAAMLDALTPERLAERITLIRQAALLVIDANLSEATLAWLFAQGVDAPVFADAVSGAKCERLRPWLARLHTLKVNRIEMHRLVGIECRVERDLDAAADALHDQGTRRVLLSLGSDGLYWSERSSGTTSARGRSGALQVQVRSSTGAGDALLAGMVHGHRWGLAPAQAARFACGCAAMTLGCGAANHPQLSVAAVQHLLAGRATEEQRGCAPGQNSAHQAP